MADIAMCKSIDCPIKEQCYRYTAPESKFWQSYFIEQPGKYQNPSKPKIEEFECEYYWENGKKISSHRED